MVLNCHVGAGDQILVLLKVEPSLQAHGLSLFLTHDIQTSYKLVIVLLQPLECWDCRGAASGCLFPLLVLYCWPRLAAGLLPSPSSGLFSPLALGASLVLLCDYSVVSPPGPHVPGLVLFSSHLHSWAESLTESQ